MRGGHSCLNFLWPSWTLDTRFRFVAACIGTMVLGFAVEGFSKFRYRLHASRAPRQRNRHRNNSLRLLVRPLLHGAQGLMGYVLMLITMTYSVELLLSVVIGLGVGYGVWFRFEDQHQASSANPCCDFLQEQEDCYESLLPPPPTTTTVPDESLEQRRTGSEEGADDARRGLL